MFATVLGAFPITAEPTDPDPIESVRGSVAAGAADPDEVRGTGDALVRRLIDDLTGTGLELIGDGQVRWADAVEAVAAALGHRPGKAFAARHVARTRPISIDDWAFAAACTMRPVKQALPGPYTIARRLGTGRGRRSLGLALGEALHDEIAELADAGCPLIEIDEPDAPAIGTDAAEARHFSDAHARLTDGIEGTHLSLVLTTGNVDGTPDATFFEHPYASFAFDLVAGPDNWRLIARAPHERGIVCGALSAASDSDDRPDLLVWAAHYAASTAGRGPDRIGLANASSLRGLPRARAMAKVRSLVDAVRIASVGSTQELAAALDSRAVDSRMALTGRFRPRTRKIGGAVVRPTRSQPDD